MEQVIHSLNHRRRPKEGEKADKAFVVVGTGVDALRQAQRVRTGEVQRDKTVPADKYLTLVFFAYTSGRFLRIDEIQQLGNKTEIKYHLKACEATRASTQFALIPLGKLPAGEANVTVARNPDTGPSYLVSRAIPAARLVSGSFTFNVK